MTPEMVLIPAGHFWMGADERIDKFASAVERPRHEIRIDYSFSIGKYPITRAEWNAFVGQPSACRLPVVNVSWDDAVAYTLWLREKTGRRFRLPSEAEWEYCCRAGSDTVFSTGNSISVSDANFLYLDFGDRPGVGKLTEVGSYPPNAFGLFDMHGNVCELVSDAWHANYENAPPNGSCWCDGAASPWRVVRGGGWDALPRVVRSAFRDWIRRDQRMDNVGFRVACDI